MQRYQWDWGVLFREPYFGWLLSGLGWTLTIALLAWVIAFTVGSAVGICRTLPNRWVRLIGTTYVELFRNVPLLVQMFLWFFVLPELVPRDLGHWLKRDMPYPDSPMPCCALASTRRRASPSRSDLAFKGRAGLVARCIGDGPDAAADLWVRAAADCVSPNCADAHLGVPGDHQELFCGADNRHVGADQPE